MKNYIVSLGRALIRPIFKYLIVMKMIILFLLITLYQAKAGVIGQTLHIKGTKISLIHLFREIKKQTGYTVICNAEIMKQTPPIDIEINNKPLSEGLSIILLAHGLSYEIVKNSIIISKVDETNLGATEKLKKQQEQPISGQVTGENGQILVGASVLIKGGTRQTKTDNQGKYALLAKENDVLLFTFVGFKTKEISVGSSRKIDITLAALHLNIDEVVVSVGYGQQKKTHVTGSVVQVSSKELLKVPMANISQALVGRLPGVVFKQTSGQPGADGSSMLVRGYGTYNNSSPLILVDGIERSFQNIDPNDVESISVLKDAATAAVYGVKGAHGVILVTTKRGKSGIKPTFTYNGSATASQNTQLPKFLTGTEYANWHNKANIMDGNKPWFSEEQIAMMSNGDASDGLENTDWQKEFLGHLAPATQHNISVNGGNENIRYFSSIGGMLQDGIVKDMRFERYNVRTNIDMNPSPDWLLSVSLAGRLENSHNPGSISYGKQVGYNPISQALYMYPFLPFEYKGLPTGSSYMTLNPFAAAELSGFQESKQTLFETSAQLSYSPKYLKGLTLALFGSYDKKYVNAKTFSTPYTVNTFIAETGTYSKVMSDGFLAKGSLFQNSDNFTQALVRPSLRYTKKIGKHDIEGLLLFEWQRGDSNTLYASRWGFPIHDLPELSLGQIFPPTPNAGMSDESVRAGYVGRLNYAYDSRYLAEVAFRRDGSYKFPQHSRWGFFPSLSLGWIVSNEKFWKENIGENHYLKIRGSAGLLGQDNVSPFLYKQLFSLSTSPVIALGNQLTPEFGLVSTSSYPSVDLTWEKTRTYNIGAELGLWNNKLNIEVDGFYKYTYDILQNIGNVYPSSLGGNYPTIENSGSVDVKGLELQLKYRNRIGDLHYNLGGNLSYAKNRILSIVETENIHPWQSMLGKSIGQRSTYIATGLYQTAEQLANSPAPPGGGYKRLGDIMYKDLNGDGKLTRQDDMAVGTRPDMPELMYAFNVDLQYKAFDFSMMWQGSALNDILLSGMYDHGIPDNTIFTTAFYGNGYNSPRYLLEDSWTPEHTNARYPRLSLVPSGGNSLDSSWWIENGAFIRLKNASLGYTLQEATLKRANIKSMRIFISGANLLTFAKFKYLDPESPSVQNGYYPQQRIFTFGTNLTF